jgi:hypothetical protein
LVKQGKLPKELKTEYEVQNETMSFKDFVDQIQINEKLGKNADMGDYIDDFQKSDSPQFKGKSKEKRKDMAIAAYLDKKDKNEGAYGYEKQDPDVKDKKGTQPAKYYKGLSKSTKQKRDAHFKAKKTGPAPGDADAKTKPSVHTKKFKQMYGEDGPCWDTHKQVGMKKKSGKMVPNCVPKNEDLNEWGEITEKDDKSGKELNNPTKGDVKKYKVYVKNDKGNVVKVEFGDPNMSIKRDDPEARKNFRARHNCDQKKDKTTAGYWSCKFWSTKSVTDLMKG